MHQMYIAAVLFMCIECFHGQVELLGETEAQGRKAYICLDDTTRWEAQEANTVCTQVGYSSKGE